MGIVDICSLGYYNVSKSILSFDNRGNDRIPPPPPYKVPNLHPHKYYKTGSSEEMDSQARQILFDKEAEDPYPWLDIDDPRRNLTDEPILEKSIDLIQI